LIRSWLWRRFRIAGSPNCSSRGYADSSPYGTNSTWRCAISPPRYSALFQVPEDNFDLHDAVKAFAAQHGLTTQIITDQALRYRCRASVAWRLGTALYAKAGGTTLQLDERSCLLWVAGNAPNASLSSAANYLQGGKGTPRPLLLTRDAGRGPLDEAAPQVLALSKMNWNNDALYDALPCTVQYAKVLANTLKHMPELGSQPYDYRFFM
jgi:hypothetical protein